MKFRINADQFKRAVSPAADVALKNIRKYKNKEAFNYAEMLTIEASPIVLNIKAYGGWASVNVKVSESDGYICQEVGVFTIEAKELVDALKSFSATAHLSVCGVDCQLKISLGPDHEVLVKLPAIDIPIKCPRLPKTIEQEAIVNRASFVRGMKKVAWAMAKDEKMSTYMCTLFECWENKMRFTAGSGGIFAIFDMNECQSIIVDEDVRILIPKHNVGNLIRIFGKVDSSTIQIRGAESDSSLGVPEQLVLESDSIVMVLYGTEGFAKYPVMDEIINHNYSHQIPTRAEDWIDVGKAIHATRPGHDSHIHNTRITADMLHGYFTIQTNTKQRLKKRIDFELGRIVTDTSKDKAHQPWFCCNSTNIEEIARKGYKDGIMTMSFDDQAKLAEIPEDKPKQMKPVLITYPERVNKDGTTEKYAVFFTVSTKQ